ncbi:predicted protein [Streptomyces viridochromogenes DSM 40736]|uniref:Predicted protein n=1 Tax=Streptomyces viridochromogenes (strain DSM 40736 / JCM 4977 / BCRC 1201 / Tue 494) TaxID=591159 RepID=D9XIH4_STRVT|nr:predicted protein [Streptomyces viridochromogenes DSM 40736]
MPVLGRPSLSEAPDHGDGPGAEEEVQIGYAGVQGTPADVEVAHLGRPAVHGGPGPFATGDGPGPAGVGGEGAVGRSKHRSARSCETAAN